MIIGALNADYEPIIQLTVRGNDGVVIQFDAVVDTGFNGFLTLPREILSRLGCQRLGLSRATLATGTVELLDLFEVQMLWDRKLWRIEAEAVDDVPLIGMAALLGYELRIEAKEGGAVTISLLEE
ncbi:MAG: clan AA aspartic protease [Planctomycetes bacterium]|nr:clan AA aspartic protease [Planctomycetota bacterium]